MCNKGCYNRIYLIDIRIKPYNTYKASSIQDIINAMFMSNIAIYYQIFMKLFLTCVEFFEDFSMLRLFFLQLSFKSIYLFW